MSEKKTSSKSKGGRPRSEKYSEDMFRREYPGQEPSKRIMKPVIPDPEASDILGDGEDDPRTKGLKEGHPYLVYPPPKKNDVFRNKWMQLVPIISSRNDFQTHHLDQLEVLCDLYVEYDELARFVRTHGHSYEAHGRAGKQIKIFPEVAHKNKVQGEIRSFTTLLSLNLKKDTTTAGSGKDDSWK